LRSAFTNKSLRMEAFVCAAEHDDFCLGQLPKIIERRRSGANCSVIRRVM